MTMQGFFLFHLVQLTCASWFCKGVCVCVRMIPYNNIIYRKHYWQVCIIPHNGAFWKGCITPFATPQHLVVTIQLLTIFFIVGGDCA
jgi:hypothetical protein